MDKQFDFEQVGKRMPYNVPDGFFDQLEQNVMAKVKADATTTEKNQRKARTKKIVFRALLATAAAVALFFVVKKNLPPDNYNADNFGYIELAYNNLSTEDQEFLMEVYEEDVFLIDNEELDY